MVAPPGFGRTDRTRPTGQPIRYTPSDLRKRESNRTSQATLSAYERGVKSPTLGVVERIVEAAGYELALVTKVRFEQHFSGGVHACWVPDRLWRGRLPECFVEVHLDDATRFRGTRRLDLRKRAQRKRMCEMLLRRGQPEELDWIDGALLVDLWHELEIPQVVRQAWDPRRRSRGQRADPADRIELKDIAVRPTLWWRQPYLPLTRRPRRSRRRDALPAPRSNTALNPGVTKVPNSESGQTATISDSPGSAGAPVARNAMGSPRAWPQFVLSVAWMCRCG